MEVLEQNSQLLDWHSIILFFESFLFTAPLCSLSLFSSVLPVSPMYMQLESTQGTWYSINLFIYLIYFLLFWEPALHHKCLTHHPLSHCPYLRMFFLSHVSLVCCTSWERSLDRNILDIELLIQQLWILLKNFHDQYPYAAMSLYSIMNTYVHKHRSWSSGILIMLGVYTSCCWVYTVCKV